MLDQGYSETVGYDIKDYLKLRDPTDRSRFTIGSPLGSHNLPYDDNTFDLILSDVVFEHVMDQVPIFLELYRVTKPDGIAFHLIPGRYNPIESHMFVPSGSVIAHRWWFKLWAVLGIRNEFQKGLSADETADMNAFYCVEALNYVPTSLYKVVWKKLGFDYRFLYQEFFDSNKKPLLRTIGKLNRVLPIFGWMYGLVKYRIVYLRKRGCLD